MQTMKMQHTNFYDNGLPSTTVIDVGHGTNIPETNENTAY